MTNSAEQENISEPPHVKNKGEEKKVIALIPPEFCQQQKKAILEFYMRMRFSNSRLINNAPTIRSLNVTNVYIKVFIGPIEGVVARRR